MLPTMSSELPRITQESHARLPRAAVAIAALSVLAVGCGNGEAKPDPSVASQSAESDVATSDSTTHAPSQGRSTHPNPVKPGIPSHSITQAPRSPHQLPKLPEKSAAPVSTPSPKLAALIFKVTGSCHFDGELDNWSKNFTPYGSTHNKIVQPDGTLYTGAINDGVDGLGHAQWNIVCSDFAQEGDYTGTITDLGPDNTLGTADDRSVNYVFGISNS